MDTENADVNGNSSEAAQNPSASASQCSQHSTDSSPLPQSTKEIAGNAAGGHTDLDNRPQKELEVSEHPDSDAVSESADHSTEKDSPACDNDLSVEKSDLIEISSDSKSPSVSVVSTQKDESTSITEDKQDTATTVSSSEKMDLDLAESISQASIPDTNLCCEKDSTVSQGSGNTALLIPLEENKDKILITDQAKLEGLDTCAPVAVSSVSSEISKTSHADTSSGANSVSSEAQVAGSDSLATKASSPAELVAASSDLESVYYIKWIMFGQSSVPIVTQNENGPCPLLAIMNVLLLKEKVKLAPVMEMITSEQLMTYLGECIFENIPQNLSEIARANYEQNMQDAMGVMYKLQTGLDVNVKFTGVGEFEYTPELIIFDLLGISLYHGWLVDPQDSDTVTVVSQCSYNQLVEKIITLRQAEEEDNVTKALIAEQFLDRTASQLTYHGLCELSSVTKENELCVFFRNNHFNTLYKHNNELFLLVTDQGFLTESNVVWETLSNVDGDCHFVDATFRTYTKPAPSTDPIPDPGIPVGSPEQIDHDYQVALFLQEEAASSQNSAWGANLAQEKVAYTDADHELAMHLQQEENWRASEERQRATPTATAPGGGATAAGPEQLSQQQSSQVRHGPPAAVGADGQRRRVERGEHGEKSDKNCSIL